MASDLKAAIEVFGGWLHLPDASALLAMLATVAANRIDGDPVWLMLVGPPGGGKSELLGSLSGLPDVHPAATLTEAALLSGVPKKEHADGAKGGLLKEIGAFGIIVCKDFTSILSMNRDARAAGLAALREIYDGSWTRHVGTSGGQTLSWTGKVGLVAGCTPTIDTHHAVMGAMGERFILFRLHEADSAAQAHRALSHIGREQTMRDELAAAVAGLFENGLAEPRGLDDADTQRLVSLAAFAVRGRSAVERNGYTREIELIPEPEAPGRLVLVLARLLTGLDAIGADRAQAWPVVTKAALDSIPANRLRVIHAIHCAGCLTTTEVCRETNYPKATSLRVLEDLTAHGILERVRNPDGNGPDEWLLTEFARTHYQAATTVPEKYETLTTLPLRTFDDISETVPESAVTHARVDAEATR